MTNPLRDTAQAISARFRALGIPVEAHVVTVGKFPTRWEIKLVSYDMELLADELAEHQDTIEGALAVLRGY